MKIALFGSTGHIGQRILAEAHRRGHTVTEVVRHPAGVSSVGGRVIEGDVTDPGSVARAAVGHDAVVSAVGPRGNAAGDAAMVQAARALIDGMKEAQIQRLVVVGGAGSLEVEPGLQLVDAPSFPAAWKSVAFAHRDALALFQKEYGVDWTWIAPAALIAPGERTGRYRTGADRLITDDKGTSKISMEDFAAALMDELERPKFIRRRMTAAY